MSPDPFGCGLGHCCRCWARHGTCSVRPSVASGRRHQLWAETSRQTGSRAYDRDLYGDWRDADGDCKDTRDEVLATQGLQIEFSSSGCEVVGGVWHGPYTGNTYRDPGELHIDHVVPLKEAHVSGARAWTASKRRRFANDPDNLLAVEAGANMSKGSRGPSEWLPETRQCRYVEQWICVKRKWELEIDPAERKAIRGVQQQCR